jgi:DNA-binding response OmpR family regulator
MHIPTRGMREDNQVGARPQPLGSLIDPRFTRAREAQVLASEAAGYGAPRILLAGGNATQALMIRRVLEIEGCEVVPCEDGREAVLSLVEERPDLVLINAPLRDGSAVEFLRFLRERPMTASLACMVIVPAGESHIVASLYDAGADLVITRPTELDLLSRRVTAALRRRPLAAIA